MARKIDDNGWFESKDNPLSRVGVFPYLGKHITGAKDLNKIYYVYRPEEELSDPETLESFKLIPWIDNHPSTLLGSENQGYIPAEEHGVHGIVGENVYYKDGVVYGNIKVFSSKMAKMIDDKKKEQLSLGYRSKYEWTSGSFNGVHYDLIQRNIKGNHLALVKDGRMGKEVAVLDSDDFFTLEMSDFMELEDNVQDPQGVNNISQSTNASEQSASGEDIKASLNELIALLPSIKALLGGKQTQAPSAVSDEDDKNKKKDEGEQTEDSEDEEDGTKSNSNSQAMDSLDARIRRVENQNSNTFKSVMAEVAKRDALAQKLEQFTGVFDHSLMTETEVAAYGVEKLKINAPKGQEVAFLNGYLSANAQINTVPNYVADNSDTSSAIDNYIKGDKK